VMHRSILRPLWLSLVYSGAKAAAVCDRRMLHLESGRLYFPNDFAATASQAAAMREEDGERSDWLARRAPAHRPVWCRWVFGIDWSRLGCQTQQQAREATARP